LNQREVKSGRRAPAFDSGFGASALLPRVIHVVGGKKTRKTDHSSDNDFPGIADYSRFLK
jgi:hypothetical protein